MSALKRERHAMPDFVRDALESRRLMAAYLARPAYQQNDYIGWITRARHVPRSIRRRFPRTSSRS